MTELVFSNEIKEKQKFFPWLKIFLKKLLKNFQNDGDADTLQFLLQNVEVEVIALSTSGKTKRKEALFEITYDLFLHFWWRIRWNGKKKWSRCWKTAIAVPYMGDERSKCCGKLLYYIIYLGITLSQGFQDSEWIRKVLQAICVLPSYDAMIYGALLQVHNLQQKYRPAYIALLKHVLCTEVAENISEPAVYITVIVLFRRLRLFIPDKIAASTFKSTAARIKPPDGTIDWLTSVGIDLPLDNNKNISKQLLSKSCPGKFIQKLREILTAPVELPTTNPHQCQRYFIKENNTKINKHKKKVHFKDDLTDVQVYEVDSTSVCLNSKANSSSNYKVSTCTTSNKKLEEHKKIKYKISENSDIMPEKKSRSSLEIVKASVINEFLNSSFAEISNFSKKTVPLKQKRTLITRRKIEGKVPLKKTYKYQALNIADDTSRVLVQAKSSNDERIKLDSAVRSNRTTHSVEKFHSDDYKVKSPNITINNFESTLVNNQNKNDNCAEISSYFNHQGTTSSKSHMQDTPSCSFFNIETSECQQRSSIMQLETISPVELPNVSLMNVQNTSPNALLKLVQLPVTDLLAKHLEVTSNVPLEHYNASQIDEQCDSSNIAVVESYSPNLSPPQQSKLLSEVSPNDFLKNNDTSQSDTVCDNSILEPATIESFGVTSSPKNINRNNQNKEKNFDFPIFGESSVNLCNSLAPYDLCVKNKSNKSPQSLSKSFFDDHRWGETESLFPIISLQASQKSAVDGITCSIPNSEITHENDFRSQRTKMIGNISVIPNNIPSNLALDYKIINDVNPSSTQYNQNTPSIKVVINVTRKTPEDNSNQPREHGFGNFTKAITYNAAANCFDTPTNLFSIPNPTQDMPKLQPYYEESPTQNELLGTFTTASDNAVDVTVRTPSKKQDQVQSFSKELVKKPNHSSTPKGVSKISSQETTDMDSDFRTPNTSDCESSSECNIKNTNLKYSEFPLTSPLKSPVDDILERLNYKISFSDKDKSTKAATAQSISHYRTSTDVFSCEEFSEDSTISTVSQLSATDIELDNGPQNTEASLGNSPCALSQSILPSKSNFNTSDTCMPSPTNSVQKKRKNSFPRKNAGSSQKDQKDTADFSSHVVGGHSLRPRIKIAKTSISQDIAIR